MKPIWISLLLALLLTEPVPRGHCDAASRSGLVPLRQWAGENHFSAAAGHAGVHWQPLAVLIGSWLPTEDLQAFTNAKFPFALETQKVLKIFTA